jgi:hypothetical protein
VYSNARFRVYIRAFDFILEYTHLNDTNNRY